MSARRNHDGQRANVANSPHGVDDATTTGPNATVVHATVVHATHRVDDASATGTNATVVHATVVHATHRVDDASATGTNSPHGVDDAPAKVTAVTAVAPPSEVARFRARARSLKRAIPALSRLRRIVTEWGCQEADFGLDVVAPYAQALLDVAAWQLTLRTQALVARETPLRGEDRVLEELRVHRQEVAAVAFVIAAPAIEALATGASPEDRVTQSWSDLFSDLKGKTHGDPLGASGLMAFEQLRGLLLVEPNLRCSKDVAPWAARVFAEHDGLFFEQGRALLEALAPRCAVVDDG
jgi:hypothetical protein